MSIYSYQNVTDFLYHFQVTCPPNRWGWWFQKHQPAILFQNTQIEVWVRSHTSI